MSKNVSLHVFMCHENYCFCGSFCHALNLIQAQLMILLFHVVMVELFTKFNI